MLIQIIHGFTEVKKAKVNNENQFHVSNMWACSWSDYVNSLNQY